MRYAITPQSRTSRARFSLMDETDTVRFTVVRNALSDVSGVELAVIKRSRLRSKADILVAGQAPASVRYEGSRDSYEIVSDGRALTAERDSASGTYTVTQADGTTVATFSQRRGLLHSFDDEIHDKADQVLLLAVMFAIHDIRQGRTAAAAAGALAQAADQS